MSNPVNNIWAPWRMEYIRKLGEKGEGSPGPDRSGGCFLCDYFATPEADRDNYILWRTRSCLVLLNRFPYANGHMLIAPAEHLGTLGELPDERLAELARLTRDVEVLLMRSFKAEGCNIGVNIGQCAGAGLPGHVHFHAVPRWPGDTNYMAVLADVRVIPDALTASYAQLRADAGKLGLPVQAAGISEDK
ncbi:MAG: AP-4-A phosphorylase [Phycisphaerae bacterium]|nr:AP-4-A phosphorylase [Phycisphaerae bacterium]